MRKKGTYIILIATGLLMGLTFSCGKRKSQIRAQINDPANGYVQEIQTPLYSVKIQYQPPAYRADQEIMLNKSKINRKELIKEYDQLQQFLVSYRMEDENMYPGDFGNMDKFNIVTDDTVYCIDAHQLPYSPGSPRHEMLLLFPLSEKELGKEFVMDVTGFPNPDSKHSLKYTLNID